MFRFPMAPAAILVGLSLATLLPGCGGGSACAAHEILAEDGTCTCAPGAAPTANGCEPCAPGQYCVGGDEASVACGDGDWDHDGDPTTPCTPWGTTCAPGTFVAVADATHDRTCEPCPEGRFTALENQAECTPWRECAELEAQIIPGSRTGQPACLRGWTFQHFGFEGSAFERYAVEVDAQGLIWVAAAQFAEVQYRGIESDAFLLVFGLDDGGIGGWAFGLPGDDVIHDLAIGDDGVAHVAGAIHTLGDPEEPPTDFALAFLAGIPDQYQMAFVGEGDARDAEAFGVALDSAGGVVVTGSTRGVLEDQISQGGSDAWIARVMAGGVAWILQFGTEGDDRARAVAVTDSGALFVVGEVDGSLEDEPHAGGTDVFVRRIGLDGHVAWTRVFGTSDDDLGLDVEVDAEGDVYVAGMLGSTAFVKKLDPDGEEVWSFEDPRLELAAIALAPNGDVLVTGNVSDDVVFTGLASGGKRDFFLLRLSAEDGAILSLARYGTAEDDVATDLAVDAAGNVVVVGHTSGPLGPFASGGRPELFLVFVEDEG